MPRALVINSKDNVATTVESLREQEVVSFQIGKTRQRMQVRQDIPFGHKFALVWIKKGEPVIKYGEIIGRAICDIEAGYHVHTHNVESTRAKENSAQ